MARAVTLAGAVVFAVLAIGCSPARDVAVRRTAVLEPLGAEDLLARARGSVAFITTPLTQGSGVLVEGTADGTYVVTNAHVVDPYETADVRFEGESEPRAVDVVGVDPHADIALLGPIDVDGPPLPLAASLELNQGATVYLIGYPGETELDPEVTISSGLVSRLREYEPFEQTYVQTDAAIAGGQSGGALLDARGRVVGISGLSFAEEFALALGGPDVRESIDSITDGSAAEYHPITHDAGVTSGAVDVADDWSTVFLVVPATDDERTMELTVPEVAEPTVFVTNVLGDVSLANERLFDQVTAADPSLEESDIADPLPTTAPGVYDVTIAAGDDAVIGLGTIQPDGASVAFEVTIPVLVYEDPDGEQAIEPGDEVRGVIDYFEFTDVYLLELTEGDEVTVRVDAGPGDPTLDFVEPGASPDDDYIDDSGTGLYGYDIDETFSAERSGTYRLYVGANDAVVVGYEIAIELV